MDGRGGGVNGWGGRKTNRKARFKRIRWKRRRIIRETSKPRPPKPRAGHPAPKVVSGFKPGPPVPKLATPTSI